MRWLHVYVLVYVALIVGATLTLWNTSVLAKGTPAITILVIGGALALAGALLVLSKRR